MFEELDADDLYAELIMMRANDGRAFILVEGRTDCVVLDRFINHEHFTTVPAHGKGAVLGVISRVYEDQRLAAVFAILDRDWVDLLEEGLDRPEVVYTEFYDLDASIFFSSVVYEDLAATFCTDLSFKHGSPGCRHQDIVSACMDLAFPVGMLRFISHRDGLGLNLHDFPLGEVVRVAQGVVDLVGLVGLACRRGGKNPADFPELPVALSAAIAEIAERERYCSGHDLAKAFAAVAKHRWASKAGADMVERAARVGLSRAAFEESSVFRRSGHWRADNGAPPWQVTAQRRSSSI